MDAKEKRKLYMREYRKKNAEKTKTYQKEYYKNYRTKDRDKYLEGKKKSYQKNKNKINEDNRKRLFKNKEKYALSKKKYYQKNKEKSLEANKKWKEKNPERNKELKQKWYLKNKYKRAEEIKKRKQVDPLFKLKISISTRIRSGIKSRGFVKNFKTKEILGCTYEEFKKYIESKFAHWMNWDNYGKYNGELNCGWDLDHIIPLVSATTEEEVIKLNHYTNFQPLCSKINRDIKWCK